MSPYGHHTHHQGKGIHEAEHSMVSSSNTLEKQRITRPPVFTSFDTLTAKLRRDAGETIGDVSQGSGP